MVFGLYTECSSRTPLECSAAESQHDHGEGGGGGRGRRPRTGRRPPSDGHLIDSPPGLHGLRHPALDGRTRCSHYSSAQSSNKDNLNLLGAHAPGLGTQTLPPPLLLLPCPSSRYVFLGCDLPRTLGLALRHALPSPMT